MSVEWNSPDKNQQCLKQLNYCGISKFCLLSVRSEICIDMQKCSLTPSCGGSDSVKHCLNLICVITFFLNLCLPSKLDAKSQNEPLHSCRFCCIVIGILHISKIGIMTNNDQGLPHGMNPFLRESYAGREISKQKYATRDVQI